MHAIFDCPEYNTCRLKYPELFNLTENNLRVFLIMMIFGMLQISALTLVVNADVYLKLFLSCFT